MVVAEQHGVSASRHMLDCQCVVDALLIEHRLLLVLCLVLVQGHLVA